MEPTQKRNPKIVAIAEDLLKLTLKEVQELLNCLKFDHGIEPVAVAAVPVATAAPAAANQEEEQSTFNVVLKAVPPAKKLSVIKEVKKITGKNLKESKAMVDEVPSMIKEGVSKEEAETTKKGLEEAGAAVELK